MDPISISAASLGFISVAKDLADIANAAIKFSSKVIHARSKLEAYCREVKALESLPDVHTNDPLVLRSLRYLNEERTALRDLVNSLKTPGVRSRLKFAFKDKELDRLLQVVERARASLQLVHQLHHAVVVERRLQALKAQSDALITTQKKLVVTTATIQTKVQEMTPRSWLQSFLCAISTLTVHHYSPIPRFVRTGHEEDSVVATAILSGTKAEVIKLIKSGEAHPAHQLRVAGRWVPLYIVAALWRDLDICQTMLQHCTIEDFMSYEIVAELSYYSHGDYGSTSTRLFQQFISHTDLDLTTDLVETSWLRYVRHAGWHNFIHQRLLESRAFKPLDDLVRVDPVDLTRANLFRYMTAHGVRISTVESLDQRHKDWLMHAFLARSSSDLDNLDKVRWMILNGADPYSIVHGRMALATVFVTTNLELHFARYSRNRSIFSAWQQILSDCNIEFSEYLKRKQFQVDCFNSLRGHRLQLLCIKQDSMDLLVTWTWSMFSRQRMPGTFSDSTIDVFCNPSRTPGMVETTAEIQYEASDSIMLDNLGFQDPMPAQDDHDWVARTFSRPREWTGAVLRGRGPRHAASHLSTYPRRSHSQPRSLKGLKWIPDRQSRRWTADWLICPFTSTLRRRGWSTMRTSNFPSELGRCMGLFDYQRPDLPFRVSMDPDVLACGNYARTRQESIHHELSRNSRVEMEGDELIKTWLLDFEREARWRRDDAVELSRAC